jgi:LemA protein
VRSDLTDVEDKVAFARQFYNRNVLDFNTRVESFPGNLIAGSLGFVPAEYFETGDQARAEVTLGLPTAPPEPAPGTPPPSPT